MFERLLRALSREIVPGPPLSGSTVDPSEFPEGEYPIRCLVCAYDLRGLPDGPCPECGAEFARGHLLVEIYARWRLPRAAWQRRTMRYLWVFAGLTIGGAQVVAWALLWMSKRAPEAVGSFFASHDILHWMLVLVAAKMLGAMALGGAATLQIAAAPPRRKRRAVAQAARIRLRALRSGTSAADAAHSPGTTCTGEP